MASSSCYICHSRANLSLCPFCYAIEYCGSSHLLEDADRHFRECQRIRRALTATSKVENQILAIRPVPVVDADGKHEINKDDGKVYKYDTKNYFIRLDGDGTPEELESSADIYNQIPFETSENRNGVYNTDFRESIDDDEDFQYYSGIYDYDKEAYDNGSDNYDPFQNRIHLVNLYKPLDTSIYWTTLGKKYIAIRKHLLEAYLEADTVTALNTAMKLAIDLHLMSREPLSGFKCATIATLLRMGEDRKCYNYIRDDRVNKLEHPILIGVDSNLFILRRIREPESFPKHDLIADCAPAPKDLRYCEIQLETATILLRLRCIRDLKNLQNFELFSSWLQNKLNFDLVEIIRENIPDSEIIKNNRKLWHRIEDSDIISRLETWNEATFESSIPRHREFWEELVRAIEGGSVAWKTDDEVGTIKAMWMEALTHYWRLWRDEPSAVGLLRKWLNQSPNKKDEESSDEDEGGAE